MKNNNCHHLLAVIPSYFQLLRTRAWVFVVVWEDHKYRMSSPFRLPLGCTGALMTKPKIRNSDWTDRRVRLFQIFQRKRSIDFLQSIYKDLFCMLLHSLFLLWQKARAGICCGSAVSEHTFRGFSPLLYYCIISPAAIGLLPLPGSVQIASSKLDFDIMCQVLSAVPTLKGLFHSSHRPKHFLSRNPHVHTLWQIGRKGLILFFFVPLYHLKLL